MGQGCDMKRGRGECRERSLGGVCAGDGSALGGGGGAGGGGALHGLSSSKREC